jgi:ketosteroid isomerase-like protein
MNTKDWLEKIGMVIDAQDSDAFASYFTEDGIFRFGNNDPVQGKQNIRNYVAQFFTLIDNSKHKVINFWEKDDSIVWQGEVLYTRLDVKKVNINFTNILYMKGDLIKEYLIYIDITPLFTV